ncbi:MAG: hypothetical protein MK132_01345 [Lentisphaerales bacterium]|nr:hypothetical protein [Lentisphaerales bacterium]
MAKAKQPLSFIDIVTRADADVIREALEARVKIDDLLVIREEAYKKIYEIETEIDDICGDEGLFDFDEPPYPVAGLVKKAAKPKPKPKPKVEESKTEEVALEETTPEEPESESEANSESDEK